MLRRAVTASFILVSFAALSMAQTKPNFSGTWKMNAAKSDFGMLPGPESRVDIIEHANSNVKVATTQEGPQGKQSADLTYTIDSKEVVNKVGPREIKSVANWEGNTIVINSKLAFNDQVVSIKAVWSLSEDGKTLTQNVHLAAAMGETDQKVVFDKQDAAAAVTPAPEKVVAKTTMPSGDKPNLSGTWKLNTAKSDFSVIPGPDSRVDVIEHAEPALKLSRKETGPNGKLDYALKMSNDGKETANTLGGGIEAKITNNWEGSSLISVIKLKLQDQDIQIKQVSMLSADGQTLTTKNHITSAMGELDQVEVYDKQP